eukprot:GSChrysophyteH1.ASY1.ANO1.2412.1 assembled CDS
MNTPDWQPLACNYDNARSRMKADLSMASQHPLQPREVKRPVVVVKPPSTPTSSGTTAAVKTDTLEVDPLSALSMDPLSDPLSAMLVEAVKAQVKADQKRKENDEARNADLAAMELDLNIDWDKFKKQVYADFKIDGSITMSSAAYNDFEGTGVDDGSRKRHLDKYSQRLAVLEQRVLNKDTVIITQSQFEARVHKLHADLEQAWTRVERQLSLKIVIQLATLLSDTQHPQFYPCMFVIVTNILEKFSDMVFDRLRNKANESLPFPLPEIFTSEEVPVDARETCRNWFYKVAHIVDLIPHVFVEITLAYLVYTAETLVGHRDVTQLGFSMVQDMMYSFKMLRDTHHQVELVRCGIPEEEYVRLMSPAVGWMMKQVGKNATKELFQSILHHYREHCNDAMVLGHIISAFDGSHYSHGALGMVALIKASIPSYKTAIDVFADLGRQLAAFPPPEEQRLSVLNEVWKHVGIIYKHYVRCNAAWMDLVQRHCGEKEVMVLLSDLTNKVCSEDGELSDDVLGALEGSVAALISRTGSYGASVLTSDNLLKLMDIFKGQRKVSLCMDVLNMLSSDGDRRHISKLINGFLGKIDFGRDLEQQLTTFVECRSIFCNLDHVQEKLVLCVVELAHKAYSFMKGKHSKKTGSFVKACLAFCHITIPSIRSVSRKLQLLVQCADCALLNQCLPQTDTFLKASISLIPEMPPVETIGGKRIQTEEHLSGYLRSLLAMLVVVPGHPDHGPFYIVQGLLNAIPKFPWQKNTGYCTRVYIDMLGLLATYAQKKFPYSIQYVESNDVLYCGAPGYIKQLTALTEVGKNDNIARMAQAQITMDLVNQIVTHMELTASVGEFLLKLLELASLNRATFSAAENAYWRNTIKFVQSKANDAPSSAKLPAKLRNWS